MSKNLIKLPHTLLPQMSVYFNILTMHYVAQPHVRLKHSLLAFIAHNPPDGKSLRMQKHCREYGRITDLPE